MASAQLRYFDEVVRCGSIRIAAERLHVAPSAISRQIRNMEDEVGLPLFERHARGVVLTSAGEIFARYARAALLDHERVHAEIDDLKGLRRGHIRLCSVEGVVADGLTQAIATFRQRFSGVTFRLTITGTEHVMAAVRDGDTDIGIAFTSSPESGVRYAARFRDPLFAVVSPRHVLAKSKRVSLSEALAHPVAVPEKGFGIRTLLDTRCRSARLVLRPTLETNSIEGLRGFARSGSGVTFLPRMTVRREIDFSLVKPIPLVDRELQQASVDVCVLEDRKLPSAVVEFLNHLEQVFTEAR